MTRFNVDELGVKFPIENPDLFLEVKLRPIKRFPVSLCDCVTMQLALHIHDVLGFNRVLTFISNNLLIFQHPLELFDRPFLWFLMFSQNHQADFFATFDRLCYFIPGDTSEIHETEIIWVHKLSLVARELLPILTASEELLVLHSRNFFGHLISFVSLLGVNCACLSDFTFTLDRSAALETRALTLLLLESVPEMIHLAPDDCTLMNSPRLKELLVQFSNPRCPFFANAICAFLQVARRESLNLSMLSLEH
jgi:hypothetical protein